MIVCLGHLLGGRCWGVIMKAMPGRVGSREVDKEENVT